MVSPACLERILIGLIAAAVGAVAMPARLNAQSSGQRPSSPAPRLDRYGDPLPPGAALRLGTVRYRQDSPIYRIAFAPDGKHFVTDGEDSILRVWDTDTGRMIRRIDPGVGALADFAITSRGKLVMALGMTTEMGRGFVNNVTMTELATGLPVDVGSWAEPAHGLHAVALCPDRQFIAMGMDKHGVQVLDAWTGAEVCRFETGDREAERIEFSRDGKRLAVETQGKKIPDRQIELRLYDLAEQKESRVIRQDGFHMPAFAFSPDGSSIAVPISFDLHIWSIATGEKTSFAQTFVDHVCFSADGRTLVGASGFGSISVFDLPAHQKVASYNTGVGHQGDVSLSPDGRTLVASSGDGVLHAWDIKSRKDRFAMPDAHEQQVTTVHVAPDGKTAITGGEDSTVRLWDLDTGKPLRVLRLSGSVGASALSPDGRWLAAATFMFQQVFVWDLRGQGGPIVLAAGQVGRAVSPLALRFVDDNKILLINQAGELHELEVKERRQRTGVKLELPPPDPNFPMSGGVHLTRAVFLPDGNKIATAGIFNGVHIADLATGKKLLQLEDGDLIVPSPDGRILAITSTHLAGNPLEGRFKRHPRMFGHKTGFQMESSGGAIRLLDTSTGKELAWMKVEGSQVWALAFAPDGKTLAATSGLESGRIHLYDVAIGKETRTIESPPLRSPALAFTPDGRRLIGGMADGSVLVWDVKARP